METYSNGCPKVGWCVDCDRPVALMASGILVPHRSKKGKRACQSDYVPMEEHAKQSVGQAR